MLTSVKRVKTNSARSDFCGREKLLLAWRHFPVRPVWICGRGAIEAAPPRHPSLPPAAAKRATEEGEQDATPAHYCCATAKSTRVSGLWREERTQFQKTSLAAGRAGVQFSRPKRSRQDRWVEGSWAREQSERAVWGGPGWFHGASGGNRAKLCPWRVHSSGFRWVPTGNEAAGPFSA